MRKFIKVISNCFIGLLIVILLCLLLISAFSKNSIFKIGNWSLFAINGNSMDDVIKDGDLIAVNRDIKSIYEKNDIVCYYSHSKNKVMIIAHQIVEVYEDDSNVLYLTKGINNDYDDETLVNHNEIIGEYKNFRIPLLGYVVRFSNTTWGYLCLVVLPLGVMSVIVTYELMKELSKKKEEK